MLLKKPKVPVKVSENFAQLKALMDKLREQLASLDKKK